MQTETSSATTTAAAANGGLGRAPGTPGFLGRLLDRVRARPVEYELRPYLRLVDAASRYEPSFKHASDAALRERASALRLAARDNAHTLDDLLPEAFALARESAARVLGMRPFDVQLIGAIALHRGKVAEMQTGEGKTLTAVLPAFLSALTGRGVHVLTFNDYLARRDAAWMGPLYSFLGITVGCVQNDTSPPARRRAYAADVTYLTAKEAGFDYLRDGLAYTPAARVQRPFHFAIVDEADSILIDEARVPLVIAGRTAGEALDVARMAAVAGALSTGTDFEVDTHARTAFLTDQGLSRVEQALGGIDLHRPENAAALVQINLALHAAALLRRDVDYIVREGRVELVDELTGRVVRDRHWPDGLQAAVEAKEGLERGREGVVLGSITLQHFFALYPRLCGMTATARPEEEELFERYDLATVLIPPNRACIRRDHPDRLFTHREAKLNALIEEIAAEHARGRPVLVGTASVRESEEIASLLSAAGIACAVLNAKTDEREAQIIAEAGRLGAVTISTNMAGRGTDIKLGGSGEREHERDAVVALGGLYVIGTNRHESRRIDGQLRGRAGRQGDPGESCFFVSLDDDLFARYGFATLVPRRCRERRDHAIDEPVVRQRLAWAQRVVEGHNLDLRRTLWQYSSLAEQQRQAVRQRRDEVLAGSDPIALARERAPAPQSHARLAARVGEARSRDIEQQVALWCIDHSWVEHLERLTAIREGIPFVRLGAMSPLEEFVHRAHAAFAELDGRVEEEFIAALARVAAAPGEIDLERQGVRGPASTWTYLVSDEDAFERGLKSLLTGHSLGLSLGAALVAPLYTLVAVYQRYFKKDHRGD